MQAKLLRELNATSAMEIGELDYDAIVNAYENITIHFFRNVREDHALVILSHIVHDMSSEELVLRHSAYRSLLSFVEFVSQLISKDSCYHAEVSEAEFKPNDGNWRKGGGQRMICKFLLKHLGSAMGREASGKKVSCLFGNLDGSILGYTQMLVLCYFFSFLLPRLA